MYGLLPYGQHQYGNTGSDVEPRFVSSYPVDGSENVSVLLVSAITDIYCFSSLIQSASVEVSEDGGVSFSPAFVDGQFVSPYNGPDSKFDFHQEDPHIARIKVQKTTSWGVNSDIVFRVTAVDHYGASATKATPIVW